MGMHLEMVMAIVDDLGVDWKAESEGFKMTPTLSGFDAVFVRVLFWIWFPS